MGYVTCCIVKIKSSIANFEAIVINVHGIRPCEYFGHF